MMRINQLRIELDMSAAGYYAELDAVQLVGYSNIRVVPIDDTSFVGDMSSLVNSNLYSDFTLNTTGGSIPVHKAILAARSPYFAKMFKNSNNTTVTFNDTQFKFHDLKIALHFLYTNRLPIGITWSGLAAMSKASSLLEVPDLKSAAICTLKDRMKVDNVVCVFKVMQDDTALDDLKTICLTFMASKLKDMAKEPSFETLSQKVIISVIQEATTSVDINKE